MFVWYYTFGCKVNSYETELLKANFEAHGDIAAQNLKDAQICVINSCTVTSQSDLKLRQLVHKIRRENPSAIVAVCGCYPQAYKGAAADILGADITVGQENKQDLPKLVEKYVESGERIVEIPVEKLLYPAGEAMPRGIAKTRAIIKIQDGCDRFCTYCIIPYARGRSRSKSIEAIEAEARTLVSAGHKEIVAVGINLSDYGKGTENNLADALEAISRSGVERIRLGSLEPEELSEEIIARFSEIRGLCPHFHLAIQSGCDKTLREMGRKYVKADYLSEVELLRRYFPNCAITTDIMVGFPGESDEDFRESLETVKEITFADAHIFPYSKRAGTSAAKRTDAVSQKIKEERARIMAEAVAESKRKYQESLIGKTLSVLFEREKTPDFHQGHSAEYQVVRVRHFTDTLFRELRDVKITSCSDGVLFGEIAQR